MSEVHHALVLGLEGEGKAEASEAISAAGFTLLANPTSGSKQVQTEGNLTLFATPEVEKKQLKQFSRAQIVCFSHFTGEKELSSIEKLKPAAVLPHPKSIPNWREVYQQTLAALRASGAKKNESLIRSLYSIASASSKRAGIDENGHVDSRAVAPVTPADLEKKLTSVQQEMQAFAYSVSHDLRAPLRAVYGFSKILADDFSESLPDDAKTFVNHIMANAHQMSSLLDDLLAFYRLGKVPARKIPWNPTETARLIATEFKQENNNQQIEVQIDPLPTLHGDPTLLEVALRQLLGNAFKFTAPKKDARVILRAKDHDGVVQLTVEDNGVGFDMAHAAKLFQVFQRMHTSAEFPGNGIGLAMVKKVADMHDGRVWLESVPEQGTKVHLSLPK